LPYDHLPDLLPDLRAVLRPGAALPVGPARGRRLFASLLRLVGPAFPDPPVDHDLYGLLPGAATGFDSGGMEAQVVPDAQLHDQPVTARLLQVLELLRRHGRLRAPTRRRRRTYPKSDPASRHFV